MAQTKITITHDKENTVDVQNLLLVNPMTARMQLNGIECLTRQLAIGGRNGTVTTVVDDGNATLATGVATIVSTQVGDLLLVNGYAFTAVASGATGNQFNIGGSDTITATNLATAITGSVTVGVAGLFTASSLSNVVTISTVTGGPAGNDYDLEARGSGAIVVTGAGTQASGTLTFNNAGAVADTFTVNGVVFTAVASGATGNQYNVGGTATLTAANAVTAVNGSVSTLISGEVFASSVGAVMTLKATRSGIYGNLETLAGGQASITASGARMTGGTDSAVVNMTGGSGPTNPKSVTYKFGV